MFVIGGSLFLQSLHVAHNQHASMYQRAPLVRRLLKISHEKIALLCIKQLKVVAQCLSELYWTMHILRCAHCDLQNRQGITHTVAFIGTVEK